MQIFTTNVALTSVFGRYGRLVDIFREASDTTGPMVDIFREASDMTGPMVDIFREASDTTGRTIGIFATGRAPRAAGNRW